MPRILVTEAQERSVLAAIRALRQSGFEVTAVASSPLAPGLWSRGPSLRRRSPDPRDDVAGFIAALVEVARELPHDLLLPGTDAALLAVSEHRAALDGHVALRLPPHEIVLRSFDKVALSRAAAGAGLDAPRSRVCRTAAERAAAAEEFGYPVVVKPARVAVTLGGRTVRSSSSVVAGPLALDRALAGQDTVIVQEHIRGPLVSFAGVFAEGGLRATAVSGYLRIWPVHGGSASFSQTIPPPPGMADRVTALVRELGWEGIFELELVGRPDGSWAAIDFNPRVYGSMALAVAAGSPLPAVWCEWALGGNPRPRTAHPGLCYRWEDADLRALWHGSRSRPLRRALLHGSRSQPLRRALRPRRVTNAYFHLSDPGPALARAVQLAGQRRSGGKETSSARTTFR